MYLTQDTPLASPLVRTPSYPYQAGWRSTGLTCMWLVSLTRASECLIMWSTGESIPAQVADNPVVVVVVMSTPQKFLCSFEAACCLVGAAVEMGAVTVHYMYHTTPIHQPVFAHPLLFACSAHTDTNNHVIRKIVLSTGLITTVVGKNNQQQPSSC